MSMREDALRLAALKALSERVAAAFTHQKEVVLDAMKDAGTRNLDAELPDSEQHVATITRAKPKPKAFIADEQALLAYCRTVAPGEIAEVVRSSFTKALLDRCELVDGEGWVDTATGMPLPFVGVKTRDAYLSVRQTDEEAQAIADAFAAGTLAVDLDRIPPQLEGE